jgi:hypothetical protein
VCAEIFPEDEMTKSKAAPTSEGCFTAEQTADEARGILWQIARDPKQSGTARVAACRLLLMERDDGVETRHDADLSRRALALLNRVAN